jgi:hypothetical protein
VLLTGDLALRRAVEGTYGFDHLPTDDEMLQLAERWRPYRSLAVGYLFASEFDEPTPKSGVSRIPQRRSGAAGREASIARPPKGRRTRI